MFPGDWIIHMFDSASGVQFGYITRDDELVSEYWSAPAAVREQMRSAFKTAWL